MITVLNLNASVDKRYELENIIKGKVVRANSVENTAGGKGIHVAKIVKILGEDVIVTGFLGGTTGDFIKIKLKEMCIKNEFTIISKPTRECLSFMTSDLCQTEVLEPGPEVNDIEFSRFVKLYDNLIKTSSIIVASGSIPQNVPENIYNILIEKAQSNGKKFLLDTSGILLKNGIDAKPFFIKPNKEELAMLTGHPIFNEIDVIKQMDILSKRGIKCVVVSMGSEGALVNFEGNKYKVQIPKVKAINPVGSGDSLVGGFAVGLSRGYTIEKTLALAAACGTANAMESETGFIKKDLVMKLVNQVKITNLNSKLVI
jgi:tagatose 6-phosphate kinase